MLDFMYRPQALMTPNHAVNRTRREAKNMVDTKIEIELIAYKP